MSNGTISVGDKLHIITRRVFDGDVRRHFAGEVRAVGDLCDVEGYAFVFDTGANQYQKRTPARSRLFGLGHPGLIVNRIPRDVDLDELEYRQVDGHLMVTDGKGFSLDINEFGPKR